MKKLLFILVVGFWILSTTSAVTQTIVETSITVQFESTGNCINNTVTNSTNSTTISQTCSGLLTVSGENLLKQFTINSSSFTQTVENNVIRELGNQTDITGLSDRLNTCLNNQDKLNTCLDSNRNVSAELILCKDDTGFKDNFTLCDTDRIRLNEQINSRQSDVSEKQQQIDELKNGRWFVILLSALAGGIFGVYGIPWMKGRNNPKDSMESQHHPSAPY